MALIASIAAWIPPQAYAAPSAPPVPLPRPAHHGEQADGKTVPVPAAKDNEGGKPASGEPGGDTGSKQHEPKAAEPPIPEKRPAAPSEGHDEGKTKSPAAKSNGEPPEPGTEETGKKPEIPVPGIAEDGAALAACYKELDAMGVAYTKKSTINDAGRCGMEAPIAVTRIQPGITLKPVNEMRCATALALAKWTKRVVEPAAAELGKDVHLTGLSQGSSYICKHRDGIATRKISQHAFGNAIDIVTFHFDGHKDISIAPRRRTGKIDEGFQRAVIGGACLYFTTVLGPHADSFHQDNLHLDIDKRSHGFRLCQ